MPTIEDLISDVIQREGGFSNNPADMGGRTDKGISERAHPDAWKDGKVTDEEARAIYHTKYVKGPGFDKVADPALQAQLIDFAVHSGPAVAIKKLQALLKIDVDGILGVNTLVAIVASHDLRTLNNSLARVRMEMICQIVAKFPTQAKFLVGWCRRVMGFMR